MDIIHLSNHVVRKALSLSLNEMAVLCDIKKMSQNPEFGYQCIKSKDKIAEWLDVSRATVFNAIKTLESKGLIIRTEAGLKPTQLIYNMDTSEEIGLYIKNNDLEMITSKIKTLLDGPSKNYTTTVKNLDGDSLKIRPEQSKNYTQDNNIKETKREWERDSPLKNYILDHDYAKVTKLQAPTSDECDKLIKAITDAGVSESLAKKELIRVIDSMENYKPLIKNYVSFYKTALKWVKSDIEKGIITGKTNTIKPKSSSDNARSVL